ncbi:MAG: patatin-like phospholipase family protein [Bacteroidota bacterium]
MKQILTFVIFFFHLSTPSLFSQSTIQDPISDTAQVGLVLAGGGALGIAHVGVIEYLEELGIEVDLVGGTSMGGIAGGFYAMGYSVDQLKAIASEQDWDYLLSNEFERKKAPLRLKNERDRYMLTLRREDRTVYFSDALVDGINIYQMFQKLCAPVRDVEDFSQLPIPFYCVAVDLKSGEPIILDHGSLADALLATMAIPGFFQPVLIDDYLLVDGGVLNNFPVNEMRQKGADKVIGVKLIDRNYGQGGKGLSSILGKTYDVVIQNARSLYEGDCDLCIEVDVTGFSVSDFDKADSLIARGYAAAVKMKEELLKYKRPTAYGFAAKQAVEALDSVQIEQVEIGGNATFPREVILKSLGLEEDGNYALEDVQTAIENLQASGRFDRVYYELPSEENTQTLAIKVDERNNDLLKLGLNYDSDFGAGILINPILQNALGLGSLIDAEIRLDRNPYGKLNYQINTLRKITPEIEVKMIGEEYYEYISEEDFESSRLIQFETSLGARWNMNQNMAAHFGVESQWYGISDNARRDFFKGFGRNLWNYFLSYKADYLDESLYPKSGFTSTLVLKFITNNLYQYEEESPAPWLNWTHHHVFPLTERMQFLWSHQIGYSAASLEPQYQFYQGGLMAHQRQNFVPQLGLRPMRFQGQNAVALNLGLRYDVAASHHFYLNYGVSVLSENFGDLWSDTWRRGIGLGYSLATPVAPIQLQISSPTTQFDLVFLFTAGFDF